jgi:hypothetical protein
MFFEVVDRLDRIDEGVVRGGGVQVIHVRVRALFTCGCVRGLGSDGGCVGVIVDGVVVAW